MADITALSDAVEEERFGRAWVEATKEFRGGPLPIPPRSLPRELDFS